MNTFLKSFFVAIFIFVFGTANAANSPVNGHDTAKEIAAILNEEFAGSDLAEETIVNVQFTLTSSHEIVVLHTDNNAFDAAIKNALNYRSLKSKDLQLNKVYVIPVKLISK